MVIIITFAQIEFKENVLLPWLTKNDGVNILKFKTNAAYA